MPESIWTKMKMVPTDGLEAWHELDGSANGSTVLDYSGNGRDLSVGLGNAPELQENFTNRLPALYFDGTRDPLIYTGAINARHIFLLAAFDGDAFEGEEGLASGPGSDPILVGAGTGSLRFADQGFGDGYSYRLAGVEYAENAQLAPFQSLRIIEIRLPELLNLDGWQIGRDREIGGSNWKGWYFGGLIYSEIKEDYEVEMLYEYFAVKAHCWRRTPGGYSIFPFVPDRALSSESDVEYYISEPYEGDLKALVRGEGFRNFSLPFSTRHRREVAAARQFHAEHRPLTRVVLIDKNDDPDIRHYGRLASSFVESGSGVSARKSYRFDLIVDDTDFIETLPDIDFYPPTTPEGFAVASEGEGFVELEWEASSD